MGVGGEKRGFLTLRRLVPVEAGSREIRERLFHELEAVRERLTTSPEVEGSGQDWIPATRGETDPAAWTAFVKRALSEVEDGTLSKVVLARMQTVLAEGTPDPVGVVLSLWKENPGAHVFLFEPSAGAPLVGAAPETVATVTGGSFRATAVAGSIARGTTDQEQRAFADALLGNQKDRREHQMCVQDTVERLGEVATEIQAQPEPRVLTLSTIQHLETLIEARLRPDENVLSVLNTLHPTPAVCGLPRGEALEFLEREEPFSRGWYAGPVGWFDGVGNGVFVPALRSAVGLGGEWRLFAGAGIVSGSDPRQEWEETRIKFQPVLRALSGTLDLAEEGDSGVEDS
jgi:menaquinone-specific isochorismate synthase